jgi:hypothetical protein
MAAKTTENTKLPGANGVIVIPRSIWHLRPQMVIHGGPYASHPQGMFGICLLEQRPRRGTADLWFPIPDFSVPDDTAKTQSALRCALLQLIAGNPIYVGCLGGKGRTGLFMALLAKALGADDPISYVRENFNAHAVETMAQELWIEEFDTEDLELWLRGQLRRRLLQRLLPRWLFRSPLTSAA